MPPENQNLNQNHSHLAQYVLALVVVLAIVAAGGAYFLHFKNQKNNINTNSVPSFTTSGHVDTISATGFTIRQPIDEKTDKVVEVTITPGTVFRKTNLGAPAEQIQDGEPFSPTTQVVTGSFYDFKKGLTVKITTVEDLNTTNKVTAKEINYFEYDFNY